MQILDAVIPPRGLTDDEHRKFRKSLIPTIKCQLQVKARIERNDNYLDLCLRPMDLVKWKIRLLENGLAGNLIMADILKEMEKDKSLELRFRHSFVSTASSGKCPTASAANPQKTMPTLEKS